VATATTVEQSALSSFFPSQTATHNLHKMLQSVNNGSSND
jgi:hypothetical protein